MKQKTFFLVSQVFSFRLKKQTSKKVADTTFKHWQYICNINIKVTKEWMEMCQISHNCNTVIVLKITYRVNMLIEEAKKKCYSMVFSYAFFHIHWVSRFIFSHFLCPEPLLLKTSPLYPLFYYNHLIRIDLKGINLFGSSCTSIALTKDP